MMTNMHKAWEQIQDNFQNGQLSLFDIQGLTNNNVENSILAMLADNRKVLLGDIAARLIEEYGIQFSLSEYRHIIKSMENNVIKIERIPPKTKTGQVAKFIDFEKTIYLQRK
jgi:hypothetical protein